jgi:hypothetical protein
LSINMWRRCSACKKPILQNSKYWVCNVSTCNRKRTGMAFCTVSCWEVHLPVANHRESWAVEERAPKSGTYVEDTNRETARANRSSASRSSPTPSRPAAPARPSRPAVESVSRSAAPRETRPVSPTGPPSERQADTIEKEILVVVSRMKDYIRWKSGYNCSDRVAGPLSEIVRKACDEAIQTAGRDERRTVLDRDVPKPR